MFWALACLLCEDKAGDNAYALSETRAGLEGRLPPIPTILPSLPSSIRLAEQSLS